MTMPKTLLEMAGAEAKPACIADASLVLIDHQNEYLSGPLELPDAPAAIATMKALLAAARGAGSPVFHVVHRGRPGGLFDLEAERGRIIAALAPGPGETVIEKPLPNAFAGTGLDEALAAAGRRTLILAGFATHMCVGATARSAVDHGYGVTIAADGCATRDLPDGMGGIIAASDVHRVALAELADRFAVIARGTGWI